MLQYNNGQLRMLTGAVTADKLAKGAHSSERLAEALRILEQYDLVGRPTGLVDEFLAIAWRRTAASRRLPGWSNATRTRFPLDQLAESTRQRILELNEMDAALYAYARRRMDDAVEQAWADPWRRP